jgi:ADP-ribosylglycohydrolase
MLLELAIGDAYAAGFENTDATIVLNYNDLSHYINHPHHPIRPGCYTNATQMAIAVAEAVISGEPWTPQMLAGKFVKVVKREPRQSNSWGFYDLLKRAKDGKQFLAEVSDKSDKNGAALRAGPIGVYPDLQKVLKRAAAQAALTHNTLDGINAACAAALMTHYFIYRLGPKERLGEFIEEHVPGNWSEPWYEKVELKAWMSVRAAITALVENDRMSNLLKNCIDFSGDVTAVAMLALAAGSCSAEIFQDLPSNLLWNLEDTGYGRSYLMELDRKLLSSLARYEKQTGPLN